MTGGWRRVGPWLQAGFLIPAVLIASCAAAGRTDLPSAAVDIPEQWSTTIAGAQRAPAAASWWESFDDPLLTQLIEETLEHGTDLRLAQASLDQARAQRVAARSAWFPSLDAGVSADATEVDHETSEQYSAGLDASWEVDLFGRTRQRATAAEEEVLASEADLQATQVALAGEVALAYVELRSSQARGQIAQASLAAQDETLNLTGWRVQAGLASSLDSEQARSNREQTVAQLAVLENASVVAQHRLAVLSGKPPAALKERLAVTRPVPTAEPGLFAAIPADALRQRPDVRAAEARLRAESARLDAERADRWPNLTLAGSIGLASATVSGLTTGAAVPALLANVTLPLVDGGRRRAEVAAQLAVREQTLSRYESAVLGALEDVENALTGIVTSRVRVDALAKAREAASNAVTLAQQRYAAGTIDFLSLLDALRTALSVADSLAVAVADQTSSQIRLYKAMGGGWTSQSVNAENVAS